MLSTASVPSTSFAAAFLSSRARRRRRAPWLRSVAAAAASGVGDGEVERFATSSSITDYLRYRRPELGCAGGAGGGGLPGGELQTAVVRFKKRFPWSLLHPFLHVSLPAPCACVARLLPSTLKSDVRARIAQKCLYKKLHKMDVNPRRLIGPLNFSAELVVIVRNFPR